MSATIRFKALDLIYSEVYIPTAWNDDGITEYTKEFVICQNNAILLHTSDINEMLQFLERKLDNLQTVIFEDGLDAVGSARAGELQSDNIKFIGLVRKYT